MSGAAAATRAIAFVPGTIGRGWLYLRGFPLQKTSLAYDTILEYSGRRITVPAAACGVGSSTTEAGSDADVNCKALKVGGRSVAD